MPRPEWIEAIAQDQDQETLQTLERFNSPAEVAKSIRESRTKISQSVPLPNRDSEKDVFEYVKRVAPRSADEYSVSATAKSKALLEGLRARAFEVGLPLPLWSKMVDQIESHIVSDANSMRTAREKAVADWQEAGKKKHGEKFDAIQARAQKVLDELKKDNQDLASVLAQTGADQHPAFLSVLAKVAEITGNDGGPGMSQEPGATGSDVLAIVKRLREIQQDKNFKDRGPHGDLLAKEFSALSKELQVKHGIATINDPKIQQLAF